ncbi:MAG: SRPBCC family protein [Alphaproteobacteria bacterium]
MYHYHQPRPYPWATRLAAAFVIVAICVFAFFFRAGAHSAPLAAASISRSAEIDAPPAEVWALIGPFCAIETWHPAIASCTEEGNPPTRTLTAKDGKTVFVEPETGRSDEQRYYAYVFKSSPFPVRDYMGAIRVLPLGAKRSIVVWNGTYIPERGRAIEAEGDFAQIYEAGLDALKARFTK